MNSRLEPGIFCGELIEKREIAGLLLTEHTYSPGLRLPWHIHEEAYFSLLLHGSYSETYGRRDRDCGPLGLIFHPAGETHTDAFHNAGGRIFHIEAGPRFWSLASEHRLRLNNAMDFRGGLPPALAIRLHHEFKEVDGAAALAIEGLALEMMAEVARCVERIHSPRPPSWLARVDDLVRERFAENLGLEEIAGEVGVHPGHLARVFRRHMRCTIGEYVRQLRIQFACGLLERSATPLAEIAQSAGFADQAHFSRTFRRQTGRTPAQYRRLTTRGNPGSLDPDDVESS